MADKKVTCETENLIPCLVADSAAFIRNVNLQTIGENVYTIGDVVNEIRDSATKQRLAVLPYELNFREPSSESLKFVTDFSKKTGDFKSLSAVDLRVLALTHQLEKEFCNVDHIKDEPSKKVQVVGRSKIASDKEMAGFYLENNKRTTTSATPIENTNELADDVDHEMETNEKDNVTQIENHHECLSDQTVSTGTSTETTNNQSNIQIEAEKQNIEIEAGVENIEMEAGDEEEEEERDEGFNEEDEGDDEGWITPNNLKSMKQKMGYDDETAIQLDHIKCACLTTDFAMQNVLIQMGLHVVSVNGMLIRQARNYIQKCYGCYKETHDMERVFCPSCGNKTLLKVAITVADDGTIQYHYPKRRRNINIRGTKYSMPAPKGGRQPNNQPILTEDQKLTYNRLPKKHDNINPMDQDYVSRVSPFTANDTNSRAFTLGHHVRNAQSKNPNESKKKGGRKKK